MRLTRHCGLLVVLNAAWRNHNDLGVLSFETEKDGKRPLQGQERRPSFHGRELTTSPKPVPRWGGASGGPEHAAALLGVAVGHGHRLPHDILAVLHVGGSSNTQHARETSTTLLLIYKKRWGVGKWGQPRRKHGHLGVLWLQTPRSFIPVLYVSYYCSA